MTRLSTPAREVPGEDPRPGRTPQSLTLHANRSSSWEDHEALVPAAERRYQLLLSALAERIWRLRFDHPLDPEAPLESLVGRMLREGRVVECNPLRTHATTDDEPCACRCVGMRLGDLVLGTQEEQRDVARGFIQRGFRLVDLESVEWDDFGNPVPVLTNLIGIFERGRLTGLWGAQRAAKPGVRLSHDPRRMSQHPSEFVVLMNREGVVTFMSPALEEALSSDPGTCGSRDFLAHVHPEDVSALQAALEEPWAAPGGATCLARIRLRTAQGDFKGHGAIVQPLHGLPGPPLTMVSLFVLSATEREQRARETAVRDASLCAINNILALISGHAQLALVGHDEDPVLRFTMETIREAAERASGTLTRLLPEDEGATGVHHRTA